MADNRKNVKVTPNIKERIEYLRGKYGFKRDSQVIAYLFAVYDASSVSVDDHFSFVEMADMIESGTYIF